MAGSDVFDDEPAITLMKREPGKSGSCSRRSLVFYGLR
jgi:hypothetical protein